MSDVVGAAAAHRYRDRQQAKARRLGDGEDAQKVDASSFSPGEPLDADVKTGMRPVSRQARKDGGAVTGKCAGGRADRPARRSGGGVGESYVNRNSKEANQDREGRKHDMGLKQGGRAHRAEGGEAPLHPDVTFRNDHMTGPGGKYALWNRAGNGIVSYHKSREEAEAAARDREGAKRGGRAGKAGGGGLGMLGGLLPLAISEMSGGDSDPSKNDALGPTAAAVGKARGGGINQDSGVYKPDKEREGASFTRRAKEESGSSAVETRLGRASGGRVARQAGGPLATPLSAGMGGQGRLSFNYGPQTSEASKLGLKDGGRAKARERYGAGPGDQEHHPGLKRAYGGSTGPYGRSPEDRQFDEDARATDPPWMQERRPPAPSKPKPRPGRASGGAAPGPAEGPNTVAPDTTASAAPGPAESSYAGPRYNRKAVQSAIDQSNRSGRKIGGKEARMIHALLKGRASGGEVAEKALAAHHAEHKAMAAGRAAGGKAAHGPDCGCPRCSARKAKGGLLSAFGSMSKADGGRAARAKGGKAGTKINIIIAPGGANPQPPGGPPGGLPPNLALKPPPAMPMPMPGGAPPPGAAPPMPMPIPMPMGGGAPGGMPPPGMPPRARGGRAPKVRGEPKAGGGSGLGRLQKTHAVSDGVAHEP
ncbi:MAG TPA: hypothetical protein VGF50_14260 [Caulobacteraceae bacterium]|jgi:hypothetical protein